MATQIVWIKPDATMYTGTLDNKPFITNHYPLPESGKGRIIPFTELRSLGTNVTDINTLTISSRVTEELETLQQTQLDFQFSTTNGTLVFIGTLEEQETTCSVQ